MPDARYRRRAAEWQYGPTCIDCGGPKAENATRCRPCWRDNVLRGESFWASRTCPDCGGPKTRGARFLRCRPCANLLLVGKPRTAPVVVSEDHKWRRMRLAA